MAKYRHAKGPSPLQVFLIVLVVILSIGVVAGAAFAVYHFGFDKEEEVPTQAPVVPTIATFDEAPTEPATEDLDAKYTELAKKYVSNMSEDEKIYQLLITTPESLTGVDAATMAGDATKTALEEYPVGGIVYFLDSENRIMRYSVRYDKYYEVVNTDNPDCRFDVYFNRVYYTAKDGTLHTVRSNGKEDTVMVDGDNITRFMITGQYVFYLDDGYVCSAQRLSDSDKMHIIPIVEADNFTVMDERIVYCVDNKVYYGELNSLANEVKDYEPYLLTENFSEVMCGEDCFFFFDKDGVLCSVPLEYNGEGPVRY